MIRRAFSRLLRYGLTLACILSPLGCAGTAWLWRHSYRTHEGVVWEKWRGGAQPQRIEDWVLCSDGGVRFSQTLRTYSVPGPSARNGILDYPAVSAWRGGRRIVRGDRISMDFFDLSGPGTDTVATPRVDPAGEITLPYLTSHIRAAGRTAAELAVAVADEYREENIIQQALVKVDVEGQPENTQPSARGSPVAGYSSPAAGFSISSASPPGVMNGYVVNTSRGIMVTPYSHWWNGGPLNSSTPSPAWARLGLAETEVQAPGFAGFSVAVRCWLLCLVFAALPVFRLGQFLFTRLRHFGPNHCGKCGYDLTGNQSGRCPECGTPTPAALEGTGAPCEGLGPQ